jgi:hypothetical protein
LNLRVGRKSETGKIVKKKPPPLEIVREGELFDRTEWAFADEEPTIKDRPSVSEHCIITCAMRRFDRTEDIINVYLAHGWTQEELLKTFRDYLIKNRPKKRHKVLKAQV